jgi:DNA-binding transcriptional regulator YiaG
MLYYNVVAWYKCSHEKESEMSCAEITKKIRVALQLEKQEIAGILDASPSAVGHWEAGRRIPRMPVIRRYMELAKKNKIKVSVEDFLS